MEKINQAIIVEGTYDKIRLSSFIDANIVKCDGFDIFQNREKQEYIKNLAKSPGIVILTDSDRAGFLIRNFIKGFIHEGQVLNAFIPDIKGKEKRKSKPSKEGFLGVEGISEEIIISALQKAGCSGKAENITPVTTAHFYRDGLLGGEKSRELRKKLGEALGAPGRISTKELINAINTFGGYEKYIEIMGIDE